MTRVTRRRFLRTGVAAAVAAKTVAGWAMAPEGEIRATLAIHPEQTGVTMPENFTGLSYESAQLADPSFFSGKNTGLVEAVRKLGPKGQLRLGGSLSDFTAWWDPAVTPQRPAMTPAMALGQKRFEWVMTTPSVSKDKYAVITPESLRALRTFCDATGWSLAYGLNLGLGTAERAGAEGGCVEREMGARLDAFQVGNEADWFMHWKRPPTWNFDDYWREYTGFVKAVHANAPGAPFAGPDSAHVGWLLPYAEHAGKTAVFLSTHYYHMGYAGDPGINAQMLLTPNDKLQQRIDAGRKATAVAGVPLRLTEVGSCARGGQPGASDAFASALWAADVMLHAAQVGIIGVNMHGGGLAGVYSPIVGDASTGFTSRPITYGMRFANEFAGATFVQSDFGVPPGTNCFAYTARKGDAVMLAVINKGEKPVTCAIAGLGKARPERGLLLAGPAIDSTTGTTLTEEHPRGRVMTVAPYRAVLWQYRMA